MKQLCVVALLCACSSVAQAQAGGHSSRAHRSAQARGDKREKPARERHKRTRGERKHGAAARGGEQPATAQGAPDQPGSSKGADEKPTREGTGEHAQTEAAEDTSQTAAAADGGDDVHTEAGGTQVKVMEFSGLDIEGQLKTPQMLYFLNRLRAEFGRPRLPHRSFMPELQQSTQEKALR